MTKVGDRLRLRPFPQCVVRIVREEGDLWRVEPVTEVAALAMKVGWPRVRMTGGDTEPAILKGDPNWEELPAWAPVGTPGSRCTGGGPS